MLQPDIGEQVAYLHRELDRQGRRVKNHTARLDEIVDILTEVQKMLSILKVKQDGYQLTFKPKPLEKEDDKEEIGVEGP